MTVILATLVGILLLASGLLALVALATLADRRNDTTRLASRLKTLLAHLNGDAAPPPVIDDLLGRTGRDVRPLPTPQPQPQPARTRGLASRVRGSLPKPRPTGSDAEQAAA